MESNSFVDADFEICARAYIVPREHMGGDKDVDIILGQKGLTLLYALLLSKNFIDRLHVVNAPGTFSEYDDNNLSWGTIQILC